MYTRINSRRMPTMVVSTESPWEIAEDKSCILMKAEPDGSGDYTSPKLSTTRHCVHVLSNPALGGKFQIITPDDGSVELPGFAKSKYNLVGDLDWHYKVFIVRVDLPSL